jgi:hypothetical protein
MLKKNEEVLKADSMSYKSNPEKIKIYLIIPA